MLPLSELTPQALANTQRKLDQNIAILAVIRMEISFAEYAMELTRNSTKQARNTLKRKYPPTVAVYQSSRIEDYERSIREYDQSLATTITADTPGQYTFGAGIQRSLSPTPTPSPIFQDYRTPPPEETSDEWCETMDPIFMNDIDTDLEYLTMLSSLDLDAMDIDFVSDWEEMEYSTDEDNDEFMHITVLPDL